uniref:FAD-binding FR-type domain-containing protein n=1 Tax=Kalanchoe fedtschenkoi TaxID=63787 RepID=A0A7N0TF09_KALFE
MGSRRAFQAILLVVFSGWLMIWIMLPTNHYKLKWVPDLNLKLNSTYFEAQGTNLLLLSFPIMLIAALGCVYLHIHSMPANYFPKSSGKSGRLCFSGRPVLVMAPLGIVSATELIFAAMFIALLIWSLANYLLVSFRHPYMSRMGEPVWQTRFRSVSLRLGYIGNICWAFLFFPVTRGSSILPLVGLTSESSIKYHIWLGHLSNLLFALHSVGFFIYWIMTDQMVLALEWSKDYVSNVAGEIAFALSLVIWATSIPWIRRTMFELFFYTHHLYILYIVFYILHVGPAYTCMILPGIFLFVIDRYLRFLQSRQRVKLVSARILPSGFAELNFAKAPGLKYNPTSILFVNIPSVSRLQWHPFTVTSNCNLQPDTLSVVIRNKGTWTQKLCQQLTAADHVEASVEGPYGPTKFDFLRHELLVMVSGGSGITPFISVFREIIYQSTKTGSHLPRVLLISTFKNAADLAAIDLLLPSSGASLDLSKVQFQIEAYVTKDLEESAANVQKPVQTTCHQFKSNPLDTPVSPTLGPNSWLWLGAILSSSFVMFLLLLGIVTRYYIYPIDQDISKVYLYSYRCVWDMFLACLCIFISSSIVFLWCKKQNAAIIMQVQNWELSTPTASPASMFHAEVESLPLQSLAQSINVHYGSRPNLKKILFDRKEADVGVLVCGPRNMRHEVAKICSAGLAENLHFESISFNW